MSWILLHKLWPFALASFTQHGVSMLWHILVLHYFIWLNNIPLHRYCLCIHQLMDVWVVCIFWLLWIMNAAINICVEVLPCTCIFSFLGYIPRPGFAESYGNSMFKFLRNCQIVLWGAVSFYISTRNVWGLQFLHIFINTCYGLCFRF